MVILGIKDRSETREHIVTRKQGWREEGETREGKLGEDPEMGVHGRKRRSGKIQGKSRENPGKIHRSMGYGVQKSWRRRERKEEDKGKEMRIRSQGIRTWWGGGAHGC